MVLSINTFMQKTKTLQLELIWQVKMAFGWQHFLEHGKTVYLKQVSRINLKNVNNDPFFSNNVHCSYHMELCCTSFCLTSS